MDKVHGVIKVDRNALYEEVWSTPGQILAKKYGVSDVALAKACKRHAIPRPPRGHWAKLAHGKKSPQVALPTISDPKLREVRFVGGSVSGQSEFHDPALESLKVELATARNTVVPERLTSPHPLVDSTREYFASLDAGNTRGNDQSKALFHNVSRKSVGRALRIMDALIKAWEALGGTVAVDRHRHEHNRWILYFGMGGDLIAVELEERRRQVKGKSVWQHDIEYSGELSLKFDIPWEAKLRGTWSDGKRQRLEDVLDSFICGLLKRMDREKHDRLNAEIAGRQAERAKKQRAMAEQHVADEQQRREQLKVTVDRWHEAERIRRYLTKVDEALAAGSLQVRDEEAFRKWRRWSSWYANHIDPNIRAEPLPDEVEPPVNTPIASLEWTTHMQPVLEKLNVQDTDELYSLDAATLLAAEGTTRQRAWDEVCRVLEGLGYDMAGRQYWLR